MIRPLLVGIDPAFRKSGFCVCMIDTENTVRFKTFKNGFLDFIKWVPELPENCLVCIENSNLQNVTFFGLKDKKMSAAAKNKKSRNVGANQAASQYTVDVCTGLLGSEKVLGISPKMKGPKWKELNFYRVVKSESHELLNYTGSQDQRDAYKLALQAWQFRFRYKSQRA